MSIEKRSTNKTVNRDYKITTIIKKNGKIQVSMNSLVKSQREHMLKYIILLNKILVIDF